MKQKSRRINRISTQKTVTSRKLRQQHKRTECEKQPGKTEINTRLVSSLHHIQSSVNIASRNNIEQWNEQPKVAPETTQESQSKAWTINGCKFSLIA
jgi:hypothetical protein